MAKRAFEKTASDGDTKLWCGGPDWLTHRGLGLGASLILLLSFWLRPETGLGLPCCLLRELTGLPCPNCGLTRSFVAWSHGQHWSALLFHPWGWLPYGLAWWWVFVMCLPQRARMSVRLWLRTKTIWVKAVASCAVVSFLLFGIARMVFFLCHPTQLPFP